MNTSARYTTPYLRACRSAMHAYLIIQEYTLSLSLQKGFRHEAPTKELQTGFYPVLCLWSQNNPPHQVRRSGHLVAVCVCFAVYVGVFFTSMHMCPLTACVHKPCLICHTHKNCMSSCDQWHWVKQMLQFTSAKNEKASCNTIKCSLDGGVSIYITAHAASTRHPPVSHMEWMQVVCIHSFPNPI